MVFNATSARETDCNAPCRGNKQQMCGGAWRLSVYGTGKLISMARFTQYTLQSVSRADGCLLWLSPQKHCE
jgi:hypothetical protein